MSIFTKQSETEWLDENIPRSTRFDDTYYTKTDGRAETGHVFINGNNLPERWKTQSRFTIAELGFGTGLNFLETLRQWKEVRPPGTTLEFISFEQFPLTSDEMRRALSRWKALEQSAQSLCDHWQPDGKTFELEIFPHVTLRVNFGDANNLLPEHACPVDAWYLDGFSPAKNPQLWNEPLLKNVFALTKPGGTFATYTAAGFVRRNLQTAGFMVSRIKGFDTKREMLSGYKE
ncbi:MAG: tRNA (5-methylaminomethyl-2-thiouridine)(34)-methyltransferase MnmD [Rhizobiaceae bacterium]|nr:tRNA (5-methylaminomethyl-2-thiouridine)(34)-methyltransferase MnmD [Rhizobiaceae bacterium]